MHLVTIQPRFVYDQLMAGQVFQSQPLNDPESWLNEKDGPRSAYEWLGTQMLSRGMTRPALDVFPIWAWYQWYGPQRKRPDLRSTSMKQWNSGSRRHVELLIDVPDQDVLLSDYHAWHFALNYWYLGRPRVCNEFTRRCEALGLNYYVQKPLPDAPLHTELQASWELCLDMAAARKALQISIKQQIIQATFWTLRPEYILRAREFGQARPLERLPTPQQAGISAAKPVR